MNKEKFYITTAIAYTSKTPHIGNTYEIILTDAIARYNRFIGKDVFFLTGTDEHGQKIQEIAEASGITPQQHVDKIAGEIKDIADMLNISYDKFIRTTDDYHVKSVQKIFKKFYDQGDIYKGEYKGLYCTPCESFWTESQLVNGKCPDCGREVKPTSEEAYFFKMSKYQDKLMDYIDSHPDFIQPESRKREMINNFLKPGLQDLCVSRTTFTWGVPVEFDPGHVVYVWIDALSNYITALGYSPDEKGELYNKYWPADAHIIGKDILRFHTIIWPIMLMALGEPLPKQVFGHPWMLVGEEKMSKSRGNVIYAEELVRHFGVDAVRYYSLHEMPFAQDGTITYETIIERFNSDLANTLGNLVNRTVSMVQKYFSGEMFEPSETEADSEFIAFTEETVKTATEKMAEFRVADALDAIFNLAKRSNKYIDETAPWVLAKSDTERLKTVLHNLVEAIRFIGVLLTSFMSDTAEKILNQIGAEKRDYASLDKFTTEKLPDVSTPEVLFARIDEEAKIAEIISEKEPPAKELNLKPEVSIEDFAKLDFRVAKVVAAEKVEKADKLLKLTLDLGGNIRQIVSGIAKAYKPEDMIGKSIIIIANLKPAKIRGVESNGMLLAAADGDNLVLATTDGEIESGTQVG